MDSRAKIRALIEDYVAENLEEVIDEIYATELVGDDTLHDAVLSVIQDNMDIDRIVTNAVSELF